MSFKQLLNSVPSPLPFPTPLRMMMRECGDFDGWYQATAAEVARDFGWKGDRQEYAAWVKILDEVQGKCLTSRWEGRVEKTGSSVQTSYAGWRDWRRR